eukprot:6263079-Alexandrium_andersonii.AAC.1
MPGGKKVRVKSGTQVIDRFWRSLRNHTRGRTLPVESAKMAARVRAAQWDYWTQGKDKWAETAKLLAFNQ